MIKFKSIGDTNPALSHSPLVRATEKTFAYFDEHGPIGLTPSKALKRVFVQWAAAEFDWPFMASPIQPPDSTRFLATSTYRSYAPYAGQGFCMNIRPAESSEPNTACSPKHRSGGQL